MLLLVVLPVDCCCRIWLWLVGVVVVAVVGVVAVVPVDNTRYTAVIVDGCCGCFWWLPV